MAAPGTERSSERDNEHGGDTQDADQVLKRDLSHLMNDPAFRRLMRLWFEQCHMWELSFDNSGSLTAFNEGARSAALIIWNTLSRTQQSRLILEENDGNPGR